MIAAIRVRGTVGVSKGIKDTMDMLGLKRPNSMALLPDSSAGMLRKAKDYLTWGELSEEIEKEIKSRHKDKKVVFLKPPKKGFRSKKAAWPKGDLGYRGEKINELIKRMM